MPRYSATNRGGHGRRRCASLRTSRRAGCGASRNAVGGHASGAANNLTSLVWNGADDAFTWATLASRAGSKDIGAVPRTPPQRGRTGSSITRARSVTTAAGPGATAMRSPPRQKPT